MISTLKKFVVYCFVPFIVALDIYILTLPYTPFFVRVSFVISLLLVINGEIQVIRYEKEFKPVLKLFKTIKYRVKTALHILFRGEL